MMVLLQKEMEAIKSRRNQKSVTKFFHDNSKVFKCVKTILELV
jgi:hypothetical protein